MTCRIVTALMASRDRRQAEERAKMERVEAAERVLADLVARRERASGILIPRGKRNHWRESIELMIHGGH